MYGRPKNAQIMLGLHKFCIDSTGWLKIKYTSGQYAISPQPVAQF